MLNDSFTTRLSHEDSVRTASMSPRLAMSAESISRLSTVPSLSASSSAKRAAMALECLAYDGGKNGKL